MVLFLFVVMMLDVNFEKMRERFRSYIPVAFVVGVLVLLEMALVVWGAYSGDRTVAPEASASYSNTKALGMLIYTEYAYPFELAGFLLLVAIIAAIALTHRRRRETKYQNPAAQVRVRRNERLRIVQMPAEKREP
jgi:NADH-quinone oxidoreductase subunit J